MQLQPFMVGTVLYHLGQSLWDHQVDPWRWIGVATALIALWMMGILAERMGRG